MTWFKVDDKLHDHRKARAAGATAMGVWLLAGSWAADNLTDGFIPASVLPRWGRQREANRLVEVGLWHADEQDGEKGWRFHEWDERQPTRAQKLEERAIKAEAGRAGGLRSGRSRREAKAKQSASGQVEPPTRPDPTYTSGGDGKPSTPANEATAQTLIGEWIDRCAVRPPGRVIGQASREIKAMLEEGVTPERIRAGVLEWQRKGLHASTLPSVVHEVANRAAPTDIRKLPHASELEQPPDGLSPAEYAAWEREARMRRANG
jgi:hypothetical protein